MTETRLIVRPMEEADVGQAGEVIVTAFNDLFVRHGFPPPFASVETGIALARSYLRLEPHDCFTAILDNRVVGSGFLHRRGQTAGIGPISVDPTCQTRGVGREIMRTILHAGRHTSSLRLVQDAFNNASFALYTKVGFAARDGVVALIGSDVRPVGRSPGIVVREGDGDDAARVATLDTELTGIVRPRDIEYFFGRSPQLISVCEGQLTGYLCLLRTRAGTFLGPAAAAEPTTLRALIAHAVELERGKVLRMRLPGRHATLLCKLLEMGFAIENLQNYLVRGPWETPRGSDLLALFPEAL